MNQQHRYWMQKPIKTFSRLLLLLLLHFHFIAETMEIYNPTESQHVLASQRYDIRFFHFCRNYAQDTEIHVLTREQKRNKQEQHYFYQNRSYYLPPEKKINNLKVIIKFMFKKLCTTDLVNGQADVKAHISETPYRPSVFPVQ